MLTRLVFAFLTCTGCLSAQSIFGSMVGTATDKLGAVVPEALIKVRNLDDNSQRSALANAQGAYTVLNLRAGRYEVTAEKPGSSCASMSRHHQQPLRSVG